MANEQLLNYIKQARQSGKNNEQIRQELMNTGWQGNDIDEALKVNPPIGKSFKFLVLVLVVVGMAIVGYFASAYYFTLWPFEVSVAPVPTFTPRPSSAVKVEDTSTWKIYTNVQYGFSFKYPGDWEIKESTWSDNSYVIEIEDKNHSFYIDIAGTVIPGLTVRIIKDTFGGDIDKFIIDEKIDLSNVTEKKQITISGVSGYSVKSETPPASYDFNAIFYKGYVYQIMYGGSGYNADLEQNLKNTFEVFLPTFKFIEPISYELISTSFYPSDQKLVKKVNGEEVVLVASVRAAIPDFKDDLGYALKKLSYPPNSQKLYFVQIIDGSDAPPMGLWEFGLESKQFTRLKTSSYYNWFGPKELSPNGKYVASTDDPQENDKYQKIYLIDLEKDSVRTIVSLSGVETLNECALNCFGGIEGKLAWLDDKTIEYYVYDSSKTIPADPSGPVMHPLIEKRRVVITY